jgi:hypothetical protein
MAQCELVQGCFFTMDFSNNMPSQLAVIKRTYCNHDFKSCARYIMANMVDLDQVPKDLDPTDIEAAHQLIGLVV